MSVYHRREIHWKLAAFVMALVLLFILPSGKPSASGQSPQELERHIDHTDQDLKDLKADIEKRRTEYTAKRDAERDADRLRISELEGTVNKFFGGVELLAFLVGGGFIASLKGRKV